MLRIHLLYLINLLLLFSTVGCSGLYVKPTRDSSTMGYRSFAKQNDTKDPGGEYRARKSEVLHETSGRRRYLIDSNDVLDITVYDEPELSMSIRVSDEGMLSYPLIGDLNVKGLTTQGVERALEERLRKGYLKTPKVTVRLDIELMGQYQEKEIFVLGEVKRPGALPMLGKYITVLEAVTKAGGFTEIAAPNRTKVIRIEDGVEKTISVNLNKVKKGNKSLDIILKPGDVIVVPETYF